MKDHRPEASPARCRFRRWQSVNLIYLLCLMPACLFSQAGPPMASVSVADPVGDSLTQPAVDITRLSVALVEQGLEVLVEFSPDGPAAPLFGFVDIDTDGNRGTGAVSSTDFLTDFESGLGTDLHVSLASFESGTVDLVDSAAGRVVDRVPMILAATHARVTIPREWLSATPPAVIALVGTEEAVTDIAPNRGYLSTTRDTSGVGLADDRFRVKVRWQTVDGKTGMGQLAVVSEDSAVLWFFDQDNWEMLVKVLDGCALNQHFWVFMGATTDVGFELEVLDTDTGVTRSYRNQLGTAAAPITDTTAFDTCGASS